MNIILLSGGSGKRLWPLSNDIRSKQFLKILKCDNDYKSMIQIAYNKIKNIEQDSKIVIATSNSQEEIIKSQINDDVNLSIEPSRKDTFPAIALACYYLKDKLALKFDEPVIVCPVDSAVDDAFFENLKTMSDLVSTCDTNIVLTGIVPSYPSENYGYIIPESKDIFAKVLEFKEKPNKEVATKYIESGALWNSGVFGFKLGYMSDIVKNITGFSSYSDLLKNYETLEKISFDYAVCEKEKDITVCRFDGTWSDIGTWDNLTANIDENEIGENIHAGNCISTTIINETSLPIIANEVSDSIIVASYDGILFSNKKHSSNIKTMAESLQATNNVSEYSWGTDSCIYRNSKSKIAVTTIWKNKTMAVSPSKECAEFIVVVSGHGMLETGDNSINVEPGYSFKVETDKEWHLYAKEQVELHRVCLFK